MASEAIPVMVQGRIVWTVGDLFAGRKKVDMNTKQPRINAQGEQMMEYGFGLAVPKANLQDMAPGKPGEFWRVMHEQAGSLYPSRQAPPGFAMKYKDGDGLDDKGIPFAQREGHAGCVILACTTSIPIKWFKFEGGVNIMVNEGIKCGDYVEVQLMIKAHAAFGAGKAGLYLNPNAVRFLAYGHPIVNTPSGDAIFGTAMPAIPQGGSAVPLGIQAPMPGAAPAAPTFQQPAQQPQAFAQAPTPHHAVLPPALQPPPGGQPMPMQQFAPPQAPAPAAPQYQPPQMPGVPTFQQ